MRWLAGWVLLGITCPPGAPSVSHEPIRPVPPATSLHPAKVALGRKLFHDVRLSHDGSISCASCHDLARGGADGRARSRGIGGQESTRNAPTVYNAALAFRLFWDGRAATLEDQIDGPIQNPREMGSTWAEVAAKLSTDPALVAEFQRLFGAPPNRGSIRAAIAEFERSLNTPDRPLDRFLCGDTTALSAMEREGYQLFKSYGCDSCHQGAGVGGNLYQRIGAMANPTAAGRNLERDPGRFAVTGREGDRYVFKVPSLRNVALTAPYFHDGSVRTLDAAVDEMARFQLGIELDDAEIEAIVAFLGALTGDTLSAQREEPSL